jgi:hypothetical protein
MMGELKLMVPAGADLADSANVRACLSALGGVLTQQSAGLGDMLINGVIGTG